MDPNFALTLRASQQAYFDAVAATLASNGLSADSVPDYGPTARSGNVSNPYRDSAGRFVMPMHVAVSPLNGETATTQTVIPASTVAGNSLKPSLQLWGFALVVVVLAFFFRR